MKYPDSGSSSLFDIYKEPTKQRTDSISIAETVDIIEEKTEKNPDDFSETIGKENYESPFPDIKSESEQEHEKASEIEKPIIDFEKQAELVVDFIDGAGQLLLPVAYQYSMFTREEYRRLKEIEKKAKRKEETTFTPEDLELQSKYEDFKLICETLPYDGKEIEFQVSPLAAVMKKRNWHISEELLLIMAIVVVNGKRLMPLLAKFKI